MDTGAIADAIAARFASGTLTPPAGYSAVLTATADAPGRIANLPAVVVLPTEGELDTGNGVRAGRLEWSCRFYWAETAYPEQESRALLDWLEVLLDALRGAVQLGGTVARAVIDGYTVGSMSYAGDTFAGIELRVSTVTSEAWSATA